MRDRISAEDTGNTTVALVTFTDESALAEYDDRHQLDFTMLRDPDLRGYRAFGLGRASLARVWGLRAARRYAEIIRADGWRGLHRPTEDTRQLGGDFVVDPAGRLSWGFWSEGPDDRPTADELVAAVHAADST